MKSCNFLPVTTALILVLLLAGCTSLPAQPPGSTPTQASAPQLTPAGSFTQDELETLASFKQVADLPFYVMTYTGDYDLEDLISPPSATVLESLISWANLDKAHAQPVDLEPGNSTWACTVFATLHPDGERLLGRNFDWQVHPALLLFTDPPNGYASVTMVDISYLEFKDLPLDATEQRGLLEAPTIPFDGMNEHGLAIGMMAVPHGEGGNDPSKPTVGELGVIRLLLDNARTVDEALALLEGYNVDFGGGPPIHYLITDRSGAAAVVELIGDDQIVTRNTQLWLVSTNFLIAEEKPDGADSSCNRYNHTYAQLEAADGKIDSAEAMDLLSEVAQNGDYPTIWSVVYDLKNGKLQVVIRREFDKVEEFELIMK